MRSEHTHSECWILTLAREEGDEGWPGTMPKPWSRIGASFRPDEITAVIRRGEDHA